MFLERRYCIIFLNKSIYSAILCGNKCNISDKGKFAGSSPTATFLIFVLRKCSIDSYNTESRVQYILPMEFEIHRSHIGTPAFSALIGKI